MCMQENTFSLERSVVHKTPAAEKARSASTDIAGIDVR